MAGRTDQLDRCLRRTLVLLLLLAVLAVSRDMPSSSASGIQLLPMKLRWSIAWAGLHARSPLRPLAAHLALAIDPGRRTSLGRRAALHLAREGKAEDRLRWSAVLARGDRRNLLLFVRAVRAALATGDCGSLRMAVRLARSLSRGDRAKVAREFGHPRHARWGSVALRAGLRVADRPELRRALQRPQRRPMIQGNSVPCAM